MPEQLPPQEIQVGESTSFILIVFPDGTHSTNCIIQSNLTDLGQTQIAADLLRRNVDDSFEEIKNLAKTRNPRNRLLVPMPGMGPKT